MFKVVTEEQAILATQQLDLIYPQLDMLFEVIRNAPYPPINPPKPTPGQHSNGVVGSIEDFMSHITSQLEKLMVTSQALSSVYDSEKEPSSDQPGDVLMLNYATPKNNMYFESKNNKKNKQKNQPSQETQVNPYNYGGGTTEWICKLKFPCEICQGEHLTYECLQMDEVHQLLAPPLATQYLVSLTHPFPKQPQQQMVSQAPQPL